MKTKKKTRKISKILVLSLILMLSFCTFAFAAVPTDAPTAVTVSNITGSGATVSWTKSIDGTTTGYKVYVDGSLSKTVGDVSTTVITGLSAETTYSITVTATNTDGESSPSTAVNLTTGVAQLSVNFDMTAMFGYAQMIIDVLMPVLYITLGVALGFIVIRALKSAFN